MAIGEFGGAPAAADARGPMYAAPAYWVYEMSHAALNPSRAFADAAQLFFKNPANPLSYTSFGKTMAASFELFERSTRRYGKPEWGIEFDDGRRPAGAGSRLDGVGASVLPPAAFRADLRTPAAPAAAAAPDRRADVGPLSDAAARHRRRISCPITTCTSPSGSMPAWCR